jgi:NAD(P)H-dependent FMN reductase
MATTTTTAKILALAGSLRAGSFNKKLARVAADHARAAGGEVTLVDLREFALPVYDGDDEERDGLPEGAKRLKKLMLEHHGLILASPEYNSSISGALKNAIDWASRQETDDEPALAAFHEKVAALYAASPGALGGMRGLVTVRSILGNIGVHVLPDQVTVAKAHEAFDDAGALKDKKLDERVKKLSAKLVQTAAKLRG